MIRVPHHVDLVIGSLERSLAFYQELLGWTESGEIEGERGERVVYVWPPDREGSAPTALGLREAQSHAQGPYDRYAVGLHHLAFLADSREEVDERARWLAGRGVPVESGPKAYGYSEGYYAVFFYDPDGIKLELVHVPR